MQWIYFAVVILWTRPFLSFGGNIKIHPANSQYFGGNIIRPTFTCQPSEGCGNTIKWFFGQNQIDTSLTKYTTSVNLLNDYQTLTVNDAVVEDVGFYFCQCTFSGQAVNSPLSELKYTPPVTFDTVDNIVYQEVVGSNVTLTCVILDFVEFQWQFSNKSLVPVNNGKYIYEGNNLTIMDLSVNDNMTYYCLANNQVTTVASIRSQLIVYKHPTLVPDGETDITINEGDTVRLNCTADGNPRPTVSWSKSNGILKIEGRISLNEVIIDDFTRHSTLTIQYVSSSDQGTYLCKGQSSSLDKQSSVTNTFLVTVIVPPEPYFQLFTIARGRYNITIGWNLSGINSNSINVTWSLDTEPIGYTVYPSNISTVVITDLLPCSLYMITAEVIGTEYSDIVNHSTNELVVSTPSLQSETKGAFFTVTEIPPSVNNVTIVFNDTLMSITWSPPSCVPFNHSYIVTITNDSTTVTNTTTELYYIVPVSPCSNYTVRITVIDVGFTQYQSIPTIEYGETNNIQDIAIDLVNGLVVTFIDDITCTVIVYFKITTTESTAVCPVDFIVIINSSSPSNAYYTDIVIDDLLELFDYPTRIGNYTIGPFDQRFIGILSLQPVTDSMAISDSISFSTYNVQNFTIQLLQNGTTNITCYFAQNSLADGCQVKIISTESKNKIYFTITKTSLAQDVITEYMNIAPGENGVSVHDIVNNVVNSNSSLQEHLSFSVPDPVISSSVMLSITTSSSQTVSQTTTVLITNTNSNNNILVILSVSSVVSVILLLIIIIITVTSVIFYSHMKIKQSLQSAVVITQNQAYETVNFNAGSTEEMKLNHAYDTVIIR